MALFGNHLFRTRLLATSTGVCLSALGFMGGVGQGVGSAATSADRGVVNVLFAGSLTKVIDARIAPGFAAATGYKLSGFPAGSTALVAQIKGGVRKGDVFISASPAADRKLEGAKNGSWASWYTSFGQSPLLIGYNPASKYAKDLRSLPWYKVLSMPGIRVGRTDPVLDPKGKLTVTVVKAAVKKYHLPALGALLTNTSGVFPEETLLGRLESGQLDAGFFYSTEVKAAHLSSVSLGSIHASAHYTVTVLNHAPDTAGAEAFVKYLLGPNGRTILSAAGLKLVGPKLSGSSAAVPAALRSIVGTAS